MNFPINLNKNEKPNRRSIRLKDSDYSQAGAYYITICTHKRECLFGQIDEGKMERNQFGEIAEEEWFFSSTIRREIILDEFIVMPNHIYGIVFFRDIGNKAVGATGRSPLQKTSPGPSKCSLSSFFAGYKSVITIRIRKLLKDPHFQVWQRNYYEHIIRNEIDLEETREYIQTNPVKWLEDENHPAHMENLNCGRGLTNRFTQFPPVTI
jgi:putative transposase